MNRPCLTTGHTTTKILVMATKWGHLQGFGAAQLTWPTRSWPGALAAVGLLLGSFMIVFSACASGLGLYFLSRSASKTQGRSASFFACSKLTYPWAAVIFDGAIAIKCFGVGISYLIIIGDLMPGVVKSLSAMAFMAAGGDGSGEMDPALWFLVDRRFWITIFMGIITPLSFLKRLDSLKATSALALSAVVYLVFIVVYYYTNPEQPLPPKEDIELVRISTQFLTTLPIFVFAFTCHQNIFSVYNELTDNGQSMLNRIITSSIGSAVVVYHIMPPFTRFGKKGAYNSLAAGDAEDDDHSALAHSQTSTTIAQDDHGGPATQISELKFNIMTVAILLGSYIIAITVSELELVLSLVGSTGSTAISFILPGTFYYKLHANAPWDIRKVLSVCLAVYGWLVMVICLSANIRRIVHG
ncbi:hypothetical protein BGZ98_001974 [Dissophora globulifera]|nr:hypothetical protein BGZ98_001974 [Dissophora globulifera]